MSSVYQPAPISRETATLPATVAPTLHQKLWGSIPFFTATAAAEQAERLARDPSTRITAEWHSQHAATSPNDAQPTSFFSIPYAEYALSLPRPTTPPSGASSVSGATPPMFTPAQLALPDSPTPSNASAWSVESSMGHPESCAASTTGAPQTPKVFAGQLSHYTSPAQLADVVDSLLGYPVVKRVEGRGDNTSLRRCAWLSLLQSSDVKHVVGLNKRVLCDNGGFWIATTEEEKALLEEYTSSLQLLGKSRTRVHGLSRSAIVFEEARPSRQQSAPALPPPPYVPQLPQYPYPVVGFMPVFAPFPPVVPGCMAAPVGGAASAGAEHLILDRQQRQQQLQQQQQQREEELLKVREEVAIRNAFAVPDNNGGNFGNNNGNWGFTPAIRGCSIADRDRSIIGATTTTTTTTTRTTF